MLRLSYEIDGDSMLLRYLSRTGEQSYLSRVVSTCVVTNWTLKSRHAHGYLEMGLLRASRPACSSKKLLMTSAWGLPARSSAAATWASISNGSSAGSCPSSVSCMPASSLQDKQTAL
jgi:hypothetical protein